MRKYKEFVFFFCLYFYVNQDFGVLFECNDFDETIKVDMKYAMMK